MARMLRDRGVKNIVLLEADNKVGGKCLSSSIDDHIVEFGTCYAVRSHKYILKHMKRLGIRQNPLKAQRIDDRELLDYIKDGSGPPFLFQVLKYLRLRSKILARAKQDDAENNAILAMPTSAWLQQENLGKIENMMHRVVTSIGYGYLDRLPLVHAFRWVDFDMLLTGLLKFTVMPDGGWQLFWDRFSEDLDIRLTHKAVRVSRTEHGVSVETETGATFEADYLINTLPLDTFCALTEPTEAEVVVADAVEWGGYTTTLLSVERWPHTAPVNSWSATCASDANDGEIFFSRYECPDEDGAELFTVGQSSASYSVDELTELVVYSSTERGAVEPRVVQRAVWQYMPSYAQASIRDGLLQVMDKMQGEQRTYHSGASFSHEAVSTISSFNAQLLPQVLS